MQPHNETTIDDANLETPPDDRPYNPYRVAVSANAKAIVRDAIERLLRFEDRHELRKRKRRALDQDAMETAVEALLNDMMHHHCIGYPGGIYLARSHQELGKASRYRPRWYGKAFKDILDRLAHPEIDLIRQEIGFDTSFNRKGRRTVVHPSDVLLAEMGMLSISASDFDERGDAETIVLKRERESFWDLGGAVEYTDDMTTEAMRVDMLEINQQLAGADIDHHPASHFGEIRDDVDVERRRLRRIFTNRSFESGGRLFGGFWQEMGKQRRLQTLFIDGDEIAELDFGQIAPRILYGHMGHLPPEGDLYDVPPFNETKSHRKGVKTVLSAMMFNGGNLTRMPRGTRPLFAKRHTVHDITDAIKAKHAVITPLFGTGIGHWCQFRESEIMIDILLDLTRQNITALPIHDAILVPRSEAATARRTMEMVFRARSGVEAVITEELAA